MPGKGFGGVYKTNKNIKEESITNKIHGPLSRSGYFLNWSQSTGQWNYFEINWIERLHT